MRRNGLNEIVGRRRRESGKTNHLSDLTLLSILLKLKGLRRSSVLQNRQALPLLEYKQVKIRTDVEIKDGLVKIRAEVLVGDGVELKVCAMAHTVLTVANGYDIHEEETVVTAIALHRAKACGVELPRALQFYMKVWLPDAYNDNDDEGTSNGDENDKG